LCPRLVGKSGVDIPAHNPIRRSGGGDDEFISLLKLFPPLQNHFLVVSQDTLSSMRDPKEIAEGFGKRLVAFIQCDLATI
jgi:hypothetical protein